MMPRSLPLPTQEDIDEKESRVNYVLLYSSGIFSFGGL
jgi:hypothetical protein